MALLAGTTMNNGGILLFSNVITFLCWLLGGLSTSSTKWGWFGFGMAFFSFIYLFLIFPVRKSATEKSPEVERTYNILLLIICLTWIVYPVLWIIGQGVKAVSVNAEVITFAIVEIFALGVFGLVLLFSESAIEEATFKDAEKMRLPATYTPSSTIYQGVLETKN
eukprot:CAMPEP_0196651550 /NCGR_PEP_ID=MMETSP1086-20130531/554_1 /TAXON_ID=77921 /ORGANISM="Cyanoptyche  gloeocystis , Strain SAG4.97" /LENGTH=164 /DNA_ID=CAMNT_0041981615 /DNA_START=476 /DNA_END=970 /DNA_ORIENTATION=-